MGSVAVRCDYIGVGGEAAVREQSCYIWHDMDLCTNGDDHLPLVAQVALLADQRHPVTRRRAARYDRKAVADAFASRDLEVRAKVGQLKQQIQSMPPVPFH
eukprot:3646674-Karenia_brevis.AAC.1